MVMGALGITYSSLQSKSSEQLMQLFNNLRDEDDFEQSMIWSYTYDPLTGLTSETDPNGKTTYYDYDDNSRLEIIWDFEENVLQKKMNTIILTQMENKP